MAEDFVSNNRPVEVGDEFSLECVNVGKFGDGVFKHDSGYTLIGGDAQVGRVYRVRVTSVRESFGNVIVLGEG